MNNNIEEFVINDLPLAVTLLCMKLKVIEVRPNKADSQYCEFVFNMDHIVERFIYGHQDSSPMLEPKEFRNEYKELMCRVNKCLGM